MKNLIQNDFLLVEFNQEKQLLTTYWTPKTKKILDKTIKKTITQATEAVLKYKPKFMISDDRDRKFLYTTEIQSWVGTTIYKALNKAGVEKYALLLPKDLISKLSTEQTVDEVAEKTLYEVNYFDNKDDALKWFNLE